MFLATIKEKLISGIMEEQMSKMKSINFGILYPRMSGKKGSSSGFTQLALRS